MEKFHNEVIEKYEDGTVALTVLIEIHNQRLIISHLGDARAILIRNNGEIKQLTLEHRPNLMTEKERIENLGGYVNSNRVNGTLAVTRSIGDKKMSKYISHEPDVIIYPIQNEDIFLILGCDGLWDFLSNEEVALIATSYRRPDLAAAAIRDFAFSKGSEDNISVIVYNFGEYVDDLNFREREEGDDEKDTIGDLFHNMKTKLGKKKRNQPI